MRRNLFFLLLAFMLSACSVKQEPVEVSYPVKLIVKSPYVKISGLGFYKKGGAYVNLQVFSGAYPTLNYESAKAICINDKCMTRDVFNQNFFLHPHYKSLIDDILSAEPIYDSKNLEKNENGFFQALKKDGEYDISYKINDRVIEFEDKINNVYIGLTKLDKQR